MWAGNWSNGENGENGGEQIKFSGGGIGQGRKKKFWRGGRWWRKVKKKCVIALIGDVLNCCGGVPSP